MRAFAHFGGVPHRLLYDNLRAAVAKVLVASARVLAPRMQALATYYAFEPCFARPGTGHDKGGVESRGRAIRWQDLVPIPRGADLATMSRALLGQLGARSVVRTTGKFTDRSLSDVAILPRPPNPQLARRRTS